MYLLDTDVLSSLIGPRPSTLLLDRLALTPIALQFTSSITIGELFYGAHRNVARRSQLLRSIESGVPAHLTVLPFDEAAARRYGLLRAELERRGTPIGEADMRIASVALVRTLTVVTGNVRHFAQVPDLAVENWLA